MGCDGFGRVAHRSIGHLGRRGKDNGPEFIASFLHQSNNLRVVGYCGSTSGQVVVPCLLGWRDVLQYHPEDQGFTGYGYGGGCVSKVVEI